MFFPPNFPKLFSFLDCNCAWELVGCVCVWVCPTQNMVQLCSCLCVSKCECFSWAFITGFFFFFVLPLCFFVCCQLAREWDRAYVRTWPRTYPCACICDGDGCFVTVALLIFATIKTPCGAQCSESQHWDSTHLDPMAHHTSHDKCVRIYEQVHECECRQVRLFSCTRSLTTAQWTMFQGLVAWVCMCACIWVCVDEGNGRGSGGHKG